MSESAAPLYTVDVAAANRAVRFLIVAVALSVALSCAVEARAERPKPEPAPRTFRPLRPDPVPGVQPAPRSQSVPAASAGTATAPTATTPSSGPSSYSTPSSASSGYSAPSSASSGSSVPTSVTPSTHVTSTPAPGPHRLQRHAQQSAKAKRHRAAALRTAAARRAERRASAFLLSLSSFLEKETKLPAGVGDVAARRSTSSTSTLLLAGAFALVMLALGETTFLTLVGRRLGIRPARRRRQPRPTAYGDAAGPIRRVPLEG